MFLTIIIFLIILGVLIFVHELGHFFMARRNGVKAEEFGFGFPPRALGIFKKDGKWVFVWGNKKVEAEDTIYSLNLIPLGGFVKIKGQDGEEKNEKDSFSSKKPGTRIRILAAGVVMNLFLAWLLIWGTMMIGIPEAVDGGDGKYPNSKIQIAEVAKDTPAESSGLRIGDEIMKKQMIGDRKLESIQDIQNYIAQNKGEEIEFRIKRGNDVLKIKSVPRENFPKNQGALGISMVETAQIKYSFFEAFWRSFVAVFNLIWTMLFGLFVILKQLILGGSVGAEVTGPVGIAIMTKQVAELGLVYILQFAAILSINLGIINALPVPALDGGRILFIFIEKIKGSPVTQKTEQIFHTVGFLLLVGLMILVTFRDVWKLLK